MATKLYSLMEFGEASLSKWKGSAGLSKESEMRKARAMSKYEASQSTSKPQKSRPAITRERHFDGVDLAPHRLYGGAAVFDALPIGTLHTMRQDPAKIWSNSQAMVKPPWMSEDPFALQAPASIRRPRAADSGLKAVLVTPGQRAMSGPADLLGIATRLNGGPRAPFLFGVDQHIQLDPVKEPDFILPAGIRAGAVASELLAFAALAAENVTARLAGDDQHVDPNFESSYGSTTAACCEFSVAGFKFAVDITEWAGASPSLRAPSHFKSRWGVREGFNRMSKLARATKLARIAAAARTEGQ